MAKGLDRHYRRLGARQRALGYFWTTVTWVVALIIFFPVFWMVLTAFKQEPKAYTDPPTIVFHPTFNEFSQVFSAGLRNPFFHSLLVTAGSLILVLALGIPAAYALSIRAIERWRDALFFFLATKLLPYVAAIVPIYIVALHIGLLDNDWALVILYTGFNLPIAVWMILIEIPREMLEAARMDGAGVWTELTRVILPVALPGSRPPR
jgi:sorbitol/mannitol transport system permease protein